MNLFAITLVILAQATGGDDRAGKAVTLSVVAVQATDENRPNRSRHFDPGTEHIKDAVANLPYDTFKKVKTGTVSARVGETTTFPITKRYELQIKILGKDDEGRIRIEASINEDAPKDSGPNGSGLLYQYRPGNNKALGNGGKKHKAVETTSAIAPGKHLLLGGVALGEGKLAVILTAEKK